MPHYLLTGAGFTRNWGGWLADEVFEYLLGCDVLGSRIRSQLWHLKSTNRGFEDLLAELQTAYKKQPHGDPEEDYRNFLGELTKMFARMNKALAEKKFEASQQYSRNLDHYPSGALRCHLYPQSGHAS